MTETQAPYEVQPTLQDQIRRVHELRLAYQEIREKRDALYQQFEEENRSLFDLMETKFAELGREELRLRELAVAAYHATGSKQPVPGVGIRVLKKIVYDDQQALDWAREHGIALALDRRKFESIAKADPSAVQGVAAFTEEPMATIATDLSPYVQGNQ